MARRSRGSAPTGDRVLERLRQRLDEGGWPAGLTVLSGDDLYHLDAAQRAMLDTLLPEDASDFALTVFGDEPVDVSKVVAAARSQAMFSPRRVVLVREVAALDGEPEPLRDFAARPPEQSYLIVRAPSLDQRRKLHKLLAECGQTLVFTLEGVSPAALVRVLEALAGERGLGLERGVAAFVGDVCGADLQRAASEFDKLRAWLGDDGPARVTLEDARALIGGSGAMSGWEVAEAVLRRDRAAALVAARRLVEAGDEPIRILGGLAWRARTLLKAKALQQAGATRREVLAAGRAWRFQEEFLRALDRYSLDELRAFPSRLLAADRTFKSRSIAPGAVLERLLIDLTGPANGEPGTARTERR